MVTREIPEYYGGERKGPGKLLHNGVSSFYSEKKRNDVALPRVYRSQKAENPSIITGERLQHQSPCSCRGCGEHNQLFGTIDSPATDLKPHIRGPMSRD